MSKGNMAVGHGWIGAALAALPLAASAYSDNINEPTPEDSSLYPRITAGAPAHGLDEMLTKGTVHGSLRALYFSTHNAYLVRNNNQDTLGVGGYVNYRSASLNGFSFGLGGIYQRAFKHNDSSRNVGELATDQNNIGEAWLRYEKANFRITAGNQPLSLPFINSVDWRVTPSLYQALDLRFGSDENFIEATRVFRYKSYGAGSFSRANEYNKLWDAYAPLDGDHKSDGTWAIGGHGTLQSGRLQWNGDAWHEVYQDISKLDLLQGRVQLADSDIRPFFGLQFIRGRGDGDNFIREVTGLQVDSRVYGAQAGFDYGSLNVSLGYDHTAARSNGYLNGGLITPYAHNVTSGPLFARPFFTSNQDLGSGNAYSLDVSGLLGERWVLGARYSFMDKAGLNGINESLNQSEYLAYFIYNFAGALKGFSIADFAGVQTSNRSDTDRSFWQNRLALYYWF